VVGCFLLTQDTAPPYITTTQPVVLRLVSWQVAKFASHQTPRTYQYALGHIPLCRRPHITNNIQHGLTMSHTRS
jgi:hypothetical protein